MERRFFVALPGLAALAAGRAMGQTDEPEAAADGAGAHISRKAMVKHSGSKGAYRIPKNAIKQAQYLSSLTALLTLTSSQQQQVAAIYTNAAATRASVTTSLKAARKALRDAVENNDTGGIAQASATLGALTGQFVLNGATANAAVFQLLTPDQQTKLSQFQF
jgi:Spy/CpxP family protein refolding chaperone